jgi:tetratricopeptide (TPR) repeat protein
VDSEFISKRNSKRFAGEEEYIFRHALVREAAYAMLAKRDRAVGHKLAGEWLERAGEPDPWILAEHFERGEQNVKAAFWHYKAAELAFGANDAEAALLAVARGLAVDPNGENAADLLGVQTSAAFLKGNYGLALEAAEAVLQRAIPGSISHCRALMGGIGGSLFLGRFDSLPKFMGQLLTTEAQKTTLEPLVGALQWVTSALTMGGQRIGAEPFLKRLDSIIESKDLDNPRSAGEARMGRATWEFYVEVNPPAALMQGLKAAEFFDFAGDRHRRSAALSGAAWHAGMLGSLEQSDKLFQDALACSPKSSFAVALWQFYRGHQRLEHGKPIEAIADVNDALEWERTQTQGVISSAANNVMAEALLMVGDFEGSEKAFVASGAGKTGFFVTDMWARGVRASRLLVQGEWDEAIRETEDVIATCRQAGVYPARFHLAMLTRAEAYHAKGDLDAAKIAIRDARDTLLSVMAKIDDVAIQKSFLERIVTHARIMELAKQWLQDEPKN